MNAVTINPSQALPAPVPLATRYRSIRVTWGHVVAVLFATLVTSILDLAYLVRQAGQAGHLASHRVRTVRIAADFHVCVAGLAGLRGGAKRAHPLGKAVRSVDRQRRT